MTTIGEIFNGDRKSGASNIPRAAMAFGIPMLLGLGGATLQSLSSPELGIVPPLLTMLTPTAIGIMESFDNLDSLIKKMTKLTKDSISQLQICFPSLQMMVRQTYIFIGVKNKYGCKL